MKDDYNESKGCYRVDWIRRGGCGVAHGVLDMEVYTKRVLDVDLLSGFFFGLVDGIHERRL